MQCRTGGFKGTPVLWSILCCIRALVPFNAAALLNDLPEHDTMWFKGGLLAELSEVLWRVYSPKRNPCHLGDAAGV